MLAMELEQLELHPRDACSKKVWTPGRAIPPRLRQFGKFVDTTTLQPGDLVLTRQTHPDYVSQSISDVQETGGYGPADSKWTHVAIYVGDGEHVVEATFDSLLGGGSVRMTSIDEYCGDYALRFRRANVIVGAGTGWQLVVRAMARIRAPYSLIDAARMWIDVKCKGAGFWTEEKRDRARNAVICSTLFADAYNEVTRRSLGEINGTCVPAWLSMSSDFQDLRIDWCAISGGPHDVTDEQLAGYSSSGIAISDPRRLS
jgi:cell wall-associated NlpC family hydrolase